MVDTQHFLITSSISSKQISQLIHFAGNDVEVQRHTSDARRFKDREAFNTWYAKKPFISVLSNKNNDLLGISWVEKLEMPEGLTFLKKLERKTFDTTAAIRLYGEARGKGLASWFLEESLKQYGAANIWLRTSSDNVPAIKTYEKLGFETVTKPDNENKIIMVRQSS